jgi:hypothetical protein
MESQVDQLAKVLISEWIEDEFFVLQTHSHFTPASPAVPKTVLEQVCLNHAEECARFSVQIPLVLALPKPHLQTARSWLESTSYYGLEPSQVFLLVEEVGYGYRIEDNSTAALDESSEPYLLGGADSIATMIATSLIGTLWKRGIRWLLIGEIWNLGCRLDQASLNLLDENKDRGIIECLERKEIIASKVLIIQHPKDPFKQFIGHEMRFRTEKFAPMIDQVRWAGIGTYWVSCEKLLVGLGIDLEQILVPMEKKLINKIYEVIRERCNLIHHRKGHLYISFPLCDFLGRLGLEILPVSLSRFQPFFPTKVE